MTKIRTVIKYVFKFLLALAVLIVLCVLMLQLPSVQQFLTGKLSNYLESKLQTEVNISSIRIQLPESLVLKGVYIEDTQQDTFLNVGELSVNFKLNKLFRKRIQFDKVTLNDGFANIYMDKDSTNFDFILNAFGLNSTSADTSDSPQPAVSTPWVMTFDDIGLAFQDIDLSFTDREAGLALTTHLGKLEGSVNQINYLQNTYDIKYLNLSDSWVKVIVDETDPDTIKVSGPSQGMDYSVISNSLVLDNVAFDLKMEGLDLSSRINKLENKNSFFKMKGDSLNIELPFLEIADSEFANHVPSKPLSEGFDFNHFSFQQVNVLITDFKYDNLDISANIQKLSAKEDKGFELKTLQADFGFLKDKINIQGLKIQTGNTAIQATETIIQYPFLTEASNPIDQLAIQSDLNLTADNLSDFRYFYPGLDDIPTFQKNQTQPLNFVASVNGSMRELNIKALNLKGLNISLMASGKLKNLIDTDRLEMDIILNQLEAKGEDIAALMPDSIIPYFVTLPDHISLNGTIKGRLQEFVSNISTTTHREGTDLPTRIIARTTFRNIMTLDSAYLDIQLDTFSTTKTDLIAYLPPDLLPEYVHLPDQFILTGNVYGKITDLQSDLELLIYRDEEKSQLKAAGRISGLFTDGEPAFDIELDVASVSREELMAFMPDSLLPAYFQLPFIKKLRGKFKGGFDNFNTDLHLESNTGDWSLTASLKEEAYHLDLNIAQLQPDSFFTTGYIDSLAGRSLFPLSVDIKMDGRGFDFSDKSISDFLVTIKDAADTSMTGIVIQGTLGDQILSIQANSVEEAINFNSEITLDYTKTLPELMVDLQLLQLDFEALKISEQPFSINGQLKADIKGYTLDTLLGELSINDLGIHYDDGFQQIDSLLLIADLDNGENLIKLSSDFFDAQLKGRFQFSPTIAALQQQFNNYLLNDVEKDLIGATDDYFDLEFTLQRPEILTMGFIPTLEELSAFQLSAKYDNQKSILKAQTDIPSFTWQNATVKDLSIDVNGTGEKLSYEITLQEAAIQDIANITDFKTFGGFENKVFQNTIHLLDKGKKKRFELRSFISLPDNQSIRFSFAPEQLLNYQKWNVSKDNELIWSTDDITVSNWRFFTDKNEAIEIRNPQDKHLEVGFEKFDLKVVSDFINLNSNYLGGILNGNVVLSRLEDKARFTSELTIDSLVVFEALLGDLKVLAKNKEEKILHAEVSLRGNGNDLQLSGDFDPANPLEALDFQLDIPSLSLKSIEPLTFGFLENMVGTLGGAIRISGSINQPDFLGEVKFNNAAFDIEMVKARLGLGTEAIVFDANAIEFKNLKILDANGNKGIVSSYILTEDYRNFFLQASIGIQDFLVLNTGSKDNDLYYGKLLADAKVDLSGSFTEPVIEVVARPKKGSDLTYIYSSATNQIESYADILEFVEPESSKLDKKARQQLIEGAEEFNMKIIVKIAVNEDLNFKAIIDPITGDFFEGKVKGDLVYVQNPDGTMELNGSLEAVEGKYLFTYQELIRRPFNVRPGGTITWTGDPFNPSINIDVDYKVRTSAYPLMAGTGGSGSGSVGASGSLKQTFLVKLNISGTLSKTEISTSIEYPSSDGNIKDSDIQVVIDRINQDAGQQNTQAFALILFNGFLAPDFGNSDFKIVDVTGNVNNMITQQLNGLANQYIKFVELDFGLDSYDNTDNSTTTDFRVSIRKRFLNDRLTISLDGKASTGGDREESASQTYLDNITVEYALTPDGRFKIKIYNKQDFDDFVGGTALKFGGAFVFSKEFNGIQLFNKTK